MCNPHNPAGRVWTKEELLEVAKIAERHELYIISDEIHADFVYGGKHHTPMASVSEYAMEHTITAFAPSKTFNVAGLCQSYVVIPNKKLYNAYDATYNAFDLGDNIFGMTALTAAYTKGEDWLTEMLQYLEANRDFTVEYIRENIPEISVWSPEGTYLLWLDCSKLNLENDELNQFFLEKAKVKMNPGYRFGAQCSTYMRLNIGCPRAQLQEALARIEKAIKEVAEATGYTIGHISQIERDLKSPSLVALRKIAVCLDCSEVWLIMGDSELSAKSPEEGKKSKESYLVRKENRIPMKIPEIDVSYSIFTPSKLPNAQEAQMTGLIVRLKPNTWVTEQMISHGNYDESLLLLKGELELRIDNSTYMIYEGDSFYIPKNCLHNYLNTSDEEATIIVYFSQLIY